MWFMFTRRDKQFYYKNVKFIFLCIAKKHVLWDLRLWCRFNEWINEWLSGGRITCETSMGSWRMEKREWSFGNFSGTILLELSIIRQSSLWDFLGISLTSITISSVISGLGSLWLRIWNSCYSITLLIFWSNLLEVV